MSTLSGHTGFINDVAFNADGTQVATSSVDRTVRVWDAESGLQQVVLRTGDSVAAAVFDPGGSRLASVGADGLRVWTLDLDELIAIANDRVDADAER